MTILYELSLFEEEARTLSSSSFAKIDIHSDSRRVQKVQEYINAHYQEEIRLGQLAAMVGMTDVSFSRFFKLRTGKNLSDYIIDIRLGFALLKNFVRTTGKRRSWFKVRTSLPLVVRKLSGDVLSGGLCHRLVTVVPSWCHSCAKPMSQL